MLFRSGRERDDERRVRERPRLSGGTDASEPVECARRCGDSIGDSSARFRVGLRTDGPRKGEASSEASEDGSKCGSGNDGPSMRMLNAFDHSDDCRIRLSSRGMISGVCRVTTVDEVDDGEYTADEGSIASERIAVPVLSERSVCDVGVEVIVTSEG